MCVKRIYYTTYADGTKDVKERVAPCRTGKTCSHPEVRTYDRKFTFTKLRDPSTSTSTGPTSSLADRRPTPYYVELDRERLAAALPPTPRASKSPSPESRHRYTYMDGTRGPGRGRPEAPPSPPAVVTQSRHRHRHRHRHLESSELLMPVYAFNDLGRRASRERSSPRIVFVEDEDEARHRRRQREPRGARAVYAELDKKTPRRAIRWQDQMDAARAAQNERIASRPKGNTSSTAPAVHQHPLPVKGILKKPAAPDSTAATVGSADPYDELRRSVYGMDINGPDREAVRGRHRKPREHDAYWDRLRGRFEDRGEREWEREPKRRQRAVYADEGYGRYL